MLLLLLPSVPSYVGCCPLTSREGRCVGGRGADPVCKSSGAGTSAGLNGGTCRVAQ